MPLPEFENSARTVDALRHAIKSIQKDEKISLRAQLAWLNDYIQAHAAELGCKPVTFTDDQMADFCAGRSVPRLRPVFLKGMWGALIANRKHSQLERAWNAAGAENGIGPDSLAGMLHGFFSPGEPFDHTRLTSLQGRFSAVRRFFRDPDCVMICDFRCGLDGDPARFSLRMEYPRLKGPKPIVDTAVGVVIPYASNCLFIGKIAETHSPFMFILTNFVMDGATCVEADGVVTVGARDLTPSAYALYIHREDDDWGADLGVLPIADFARSNPLADHCQWRPKMGPCGVRKRGQSAPEKYATVITVRTWKGPPRGPFPCAAAV